MPLPLIPVAAAGAGALLGFGGGLAVSDGVRQLGRLALLGGTAYLVFVNRDAIGRALS
jgi:hypothetical protein